MRLFDKLKLGGSGVQHIVADNVAEYWGEHPQDEWGLVDFPNIAPPFPAFCVSYRMPKLFRAEGRIGSHPWAGTEIAVFFLAAPTPEGWRAIVTIRTEPSSDVLKHFTAELNIPHDGRYPADQLVRFPVFPSSPPQLQDGATCHALFGLTSPALLAISFMHCKNVRQEVIEPPPKLAKKLERKRGIRPRPYRVLHIHPMKQILETEGGTGRHGLPRALHICRGHFQTYGVDGKGLLFGKRAGTFWVPQHVRGSAVHGEVKKSYDVHTPREPQS